MKKILFLIHDLGQGGAEKVLVNLVNNMDYSKFDVTVMTLFDCGENRQFLSEKVKYKTWCHKMIPGNSHLMKLFSPKQLHKMIIKEDYDVEIAYLEGPCARVVSGCENEKTKMVSWIHSEQLSKKEAAHSFRSMKEAICCYSHFKKIICVSQSVKESFRKAMPINVQMDILYNTNQGDKIIKESKERVSEKIFLETEMKLVCVGKLVANKGFIRVAKIVKQLLNRSYAVHLYILGEGPEKDNLQNYISEHNLQNNITLLGYQLNPYKYVSKCDLFVCASYAEGFSTAAAEALIVGTPICTAEVSGMKEMLGENNEYGVVTENTDEALYQGIKQLLDHPALLEHYKKQAKIRGKMFSTKNTVKAVETMLENL